MGTVVQRQDRIDVFVNSDGGISIVQHDRDGEESIVWFGIEHAAAIIDAIRGAKELAEGGQ